MSAFIQPDGSINPIFRTYLVENKEGLCPSVKSETNFPVSVYLQVQ